MHQVTTTYPEPPHRVDVLRALIAGIIGGLLVSVGLAAARLAGVDVDFALVLGTLMGGPPGVAPWFVGLGAHFVISAVLALAYAWMFEHAIHHAGLAWGMCFGLIHAVLAGLVLGAFPAVASAQRAAPAPGWFMANFGAPGVIVEVLVHVVYGGTVGVFYARVHD